MQLADDGDGLSQAAISGCLPRFVSWETHYKGHIIVLLRAERRYTMQPAFTLLSARNNFKPYLFTETIACLQISCPVASDWLVVRVRIGGL